MRLLITLIIACLYLVAPGYAAEDLQVIVDAAHEGSIVTLSPGVYQGPVVIKKRITLEGKSRAVIDGGGKGTVITVEADGVVIEGLIIQNSGSRYDTIDAGIRLKSSNNRVVNNVIRNCLFGIDLHSANNNIIEGNEVSSKPYSLGLRGDAIRLWWSNKNILKDNFVHDARDFVVWYSSDNIIENNVGINSRYSIHFMYSHKNIVRDNYFRSNSVGIYVMYAHGITLQGNTIEHSAGSTGMGIGIKEASGVIVRYNRMINCARGVFIDESPFEPGSRDIFEGNDFLYNAVAVYFNTDSTRVNNIFVNNVFSGNIEDVAVTGTRGVPKGRWERNYWDKYRGFDTNGDGYGDMPYELYYYSDKLWNNHPELRFFIASPVMSFLDFIQRLAPFSEPDLILVDKSPMIKVPRRHYRYFVKKLRGTNSG